MKKILNNSFWIVLTLLLAAVLLKIIAGSLSAVNSSRAKLEGLEVSLRYGEAKAYNRPVFGYAVPYNIVWRTGNGDATEITFSENCLFNGKRIKKGKYSLWTIPSKQSWIVILNAQTSIKGTEYNGAYDVLHTSVTPEKLHSYFERLKLRLTNQSNRLITLSISWENTRISLPIGPLK